MYKLLARGRPLNSAWNFFLICHLHISICTKVMQNFGGQIRCVVRYVQVAYDSGNIEVCEIDKSPQ